MNSNKPVSKTNYSPELIEKFLSIQTQELSIRTEEINLKKQSDNNSFEYSKIALQANLKDRQEQRKYQRENSIISAIFLGIIFIIFIIFLSYALYLNKGEIVMEIIKGTLLLLSGGTGGYMLGRYKRSETPQDPE